MTVIGGPTSRLRLVTFVPVPFSPPFLLILAFQTILFHTVVKRSFSKKIEQSCLTVVWQMTCVKSHTYVGVHDVDTMFLFCSVQSVQCALDHLKILPGFARDWCRFPSRRLQYTLICLSITYDTVFFFLRSMFALSLFIDFIRYLTFSRHTIQI